MFLEVLLALGLPVGAPVGTGAYNRLLRATGGCALQVLWALTVSLALYMARSLLPTATKW